MKRFLLAAAIAAAFVSPLVAQDMNHGSHGGGQPSPSSQAYEQANRTMMEGMAMPMSGDPDKDFATMMIVHHQAAIDMARVELDHGKDPQLRALAEEIIRAQEQEIAIMKKWLADNGH